MAEKKVSVGMNKFFRRLGIFGAVFVTISSLVLIAFMVMDMLEINYFTMDEPRIYWIQFESEGNLVLDKKYRRGEPFVKPADPKHSEDEYYKFTFRGWDINGDNTPDLIPTRAYYSFLAVAIYQKKQIKPFPSSSPSSEEEPITSGSEPYSSSEYGVSSSYGQ